MFFIETVSKEMILQQENVRPKNFLTKSFFIQTVSEEIIFQQQNYRSKNVSSKLLPRK